LLDQIDLLGFAADMPVWTLYDVGR
jgi:hypothetical protein